MRLLAVLLSVLAISANAATCTINIDPAGNVSGSCAAPTPIPQPSPQPIPQPQPAPQPISGTQAMKIGGTNNYVVGGSGTVVIFPLPKNWPDGNPVDIAGIQFASSPGRNFGIEEYEIAFSPIPGDFSYYLSEPALVKIYGQTFHPCGTSGGSDTQLAWGNASSLSTCQIDSRQWYMNWRVKNCPSLCGQTFYVPRG